MSDITLCTNKKCHMKDICLRAIADYFMQHDEKTNFDDAQNAYIKIKKVMSNNIEKILGL